MVHNDEYLVKKMQEDNNQLSFATLFNKYFKEVYGLSYRYLKNRELAEDAVQNIFFKIWDKRKQKNPDVPFKNYLFTVARNELLDILKHQRHYYNIEEYIVKSVPEDILEIELKYLTEEKLDMMYDLISRMSPQKRRIIKLKLDEKMSNQEIADKLNISVNTVKFTYSLALKELREKIL